LFFAVLTAVNVVLCVWFVLFEFFPYVFNSFADYPKGVLCP